MLKRAIDWAVFHRGLFGVPPRVALFYRRARRLARSVGDDGVLVGAAPPRQVATILRLAKGREPVVEIGTGAAWTTIALALAEPGRRIVSYDPVRRDAVDRYLALAPQVADRIEFVRAPGEEPRAEPASVGFLFVDGNHEHDSTVAAYEAWRDRLQPGTVTVFHDYDPSWPGVISAVEQLGLPGSARLGMFVADPLPG
jgi:predicted O-methyltransferase YrrM